MNFPHPTPPLGIRPWNRRRFFGAAGLAVAAAWTTPAWAEALTRTPSQGEGPFYPDRLPLDTDNDLITVNDSLTPAMGEVTWLHGRVLDERGDPLRNALVEIWQCDGHGSYLHTGGLTNGRRDAHFQGFGRFLTGTSGEYVFRTIKPVPYTGRTPHIHVAVKMRGRKELVTQCYVAGHPANEGDRLYQALRDPQARALVTVPFVPLEGSTAGELRAKFDIVMGRVPEA